MTRPDRTIYQVDGHAFFVTFCCYRRLSLLGRDQCKRIVLGNLDTLAWNYKIGVAGYCLMPNHVHALFRPIEAKALGPFIQQWKRLTSHAIQAFFHLGRSDDRSPFGKFVKDDNGEIHVWQPKHYPFNVFTIRKAIQKLEYMHNNPVKAGLVSDPCAWPWSSAAYFLQNRPSPVRLVPLDGPIVFEAKRYGKR
jgi:putative transposase